MRIDIARVLATLIAAGWEPQVGWLGSGTCYADPANKILRDTPEEITGLNPGSGGAFTGIYPSATYTVLRQVIIVNGSVFVRHSAAPWLGTSLYEVSADRAVQFIREKASV